MNPIKSNRVYDIIFNTDYEEDFLRKGQAMEEAADFKYADSDTDSETESTSKIAIVSEPNLIVTPKSEPSVVESGQGDGASVKSGPKTVEIEEILNFIDKFLCKKKPRLSKAISNISANSPPLKEEPKQCQCCIKGVYFDHPTGTLEANEIRNINIFYPLPKRGISVKSKYELKTIGGRTVEFEILIINSIYAIRTSQSHVDMGKQLWYRLQKRQIQITNTDIIDYAIRLYDSSVYDLEKLKMIKGYLKLTTPKEFVIPAKNTLPIEFTVRLGINSSFETDFGLDANKSYPLTIKVYGETVTPWIFFVDLAQKLRVQTHYMWIAEILNNHYMNIVQYLEEQFSFGEPTADDISSIESLLNHLSRSRTSSSRKTRSSSMRSAVSIATPVVSQNWKRLDRKFSRDIKNDVRFNANVIEKCDPDVADYAVLDYPDNYPTVMQIHCVEVYLLIYIVEGFDLDSSYKARSIRASTTFLF